MTRQGFTRKKFHDPVTVGVRAVVAGSSAGGVQAWTTLLSGLPSDLSVPLIIVQHIPPTEDSSLAQLFQRKCPLAVREAEDREKILAGTVYFAPPDYHLLVEQTGTFSLSVDEKVNYSRPSVDVLFESSAYAYGSQLLAIVLTGANHDGAAGIRMIKEYGGITVAQEPAAAAFATMPQAAVDTGTVDRALSLREIGEFIQKVVEKTAALRN